VDLGGAAFSAETAKSKVNSDLRQPGEEDGQCFYVGPVRPFARGDLLHF